MEKIQNEYQRKVFIKMATTSLWKIQNRIDKVINYTTNPEKTENIETLDKIMQ